MACQPQHPTGVGSILRREVMSDPSFTHLDEHGRARMVDVGAKPDTRRQARARGIVRLGAALAARVQRADLPKGDVLAVARVAGILAAKQTPHLVPLCHPLPLDVVELDMQLREAAGELQIESRVACRGATGVEMEAIVAVAIAAATVYDMCKSVDRTIRIESIELIEKSGGKGGHYRKEGAGN